MCEVTACFQVTERCHTAVEIAVAEVAHANDLIGRACALVCPVWPPVLACEPFRCMLGAHSLVPTSSMTSFGDATRMAMP